MRVLFIASNNVASTLEPPLPLGMACVAAATEKAGHEVALLQLKSNSAPKAEIQDASLGFRPDVVGISVRNIDDQNMQSPRFLLPEYRQIIATCREVSRASVVVGGAGYSIFPESALTFLDADFGIQGEGEIAFPALLSFLQAGCAAMNVPGAYAPNRPVSRRSYVEDLDVLPLPPLRLWLDSTDCGTRVPVQSRRGCPLGCIYCSTSSIEGKPVRRRSPEQLVAWMVAASERGFHNFYFVDSTFNLPPSFAKDLCHKLIESRLDLDWWGIVYPKWVDLELVRLMAQAGCTQVSLGFESGSESILRRLNKCFTSEDARVISGMFADAGVKRAGFLLLGGPGETRDTVEESLIFADSLHLDSLKITAGIRIYPDTPLASLAISEGLVTADDSLLFPRFYLSRSMQDWLPARVAQFYSSQKTAAGLLDHRA